ncbi:MAG: fibronectin type III domain-containing protein [Agathobacter sp.]|nr:fibronectin type III domain-containing protein [Agathobacter sp.]
MKRKIIAWILMVCMLLSIPGNTILASQYVGPAEDGLEDVKVTEKSKADDVETLTECVDEAGDAKAATTSLNISVNTTYTGQLLKSDDVRMYYFSLTSAGMVNVTFTHAHIMNKAKERYWVIRIYNDSQECVMRMDSAGQDTSKTSVDVGLPAGNYYVKVNSDDYEGNYEYEYSAEIYTIRVNYTTSETWEKESNDSFSDADMIAINKTYSGANQFYNDVDYYKMTIASAGMVNVTFTHGHLMDTKRYWVVRIYNDCQECVMQLNSAGTETNKTSVDVGLPAGNYYIKVNSDDYEGNYEYEYSAETYTIRVNYKASENWERESNDSISNADVIALNESYNGANQFSDDVDYYKFTLKDAGKVNISFKHPAMVASGRYWMIRVYNANTKHLLSSQIYAEYTEAISVDIGLPAGDYYIKINSDDYEGNYEYEYSAETYTIRVNYTKSSKWETEDNNSYETADDVEIGTEYHAVTQFTNTADYYKFSVKNAGNFNITFKHENIQNTEKFWVLHLYDYNTRELTSYGVTGTQTNVNSGAIYLEKGTYYLRINPNSYENSYGKASGVNYKFKIDYSFKDYNTGITSIKNASPSKVKLTWSKLYDADGYIICRSTSKNGTYKNIKTIKGASKCTYTDSSVKTGKKYYYKVRAYKIVAGEKIYSKYSSVKSITAKPATVSISSIKAGSKKAMVTWKKQSGVSGYEVYMSAKKSSGYKKVKTISKSSIVKYTKKSLKKGKTYYFKVRSYKVVNGKKVYGSFSKVKSVKIK